jgi:hypothetical protein
MNNSRLISSVYALLSLRQNCRWTKDTKRIREFKKDKFAVSGNVHHGEGCVWVFLLMAKLAGLDFSTDMSIGGPDTLGGEPIDYACSMHPGCLFST